MIAEIHTAKSKIENVSNYNESKMVSEEVSDILKEENGNTSKVLAERNIPEGSSLVKEAERLRLNDIKNRRHGPSVRNITFHMSVNPSETDRKNDEATVVAFIDEVMDGLGYKDQPYKIFRHNDIEREHYHVVSIRTGKNGKKINDSFERLKLRSILKELSFKYGFTLEDTEYEKKHPAKQQEEPQMNVPAAVLPKKETKQEEKIEKKQNEKVVVLPFARKAGNPIGDQMRNIHADAMKWSFTTFEQYQALLLRRYRIEAGIEHGDSIDDRMVMFGTDNDYNIITRRMTEDWLGVKMLDQVKERISESEKMYRRDQKKRLETLAAAAAARSATFEDFRALMDKKGVYVVISWSKDGTPFGLTYLDRATRCGWKGSETKVDLAWMKKTAEEKGWTITKDRVESLVEKRNAMPSRTTKIEKKTQVQPSKPASDRPKGIVTKQGGEKPLPRMRGGAGARRSNYQSKKKDALDHLEDLLDGTKENKM